MRAVAVAAEALGGGSAPRPRGRGRSLEPALGAPDLELRLGGRGLEARLAAPDLELGLGPRDLESRLGDRDLEARDLAPPLETRDLEGRLGLRDLEARLAALARSRAPLRCALARIAGRLVAARAWERLGFARLADYARERAGLSARQLQDLAHVDGRLAQLPAVAAALLRGELPWSKARLLARVAEPADEVRWIAFARGASVRALEREVRAVDRGALEAGALELDEDGASVEAKEWVSVPCASRVRAKYHRARWVARRVAGEDLPPWACMEAVAAETLSALGLDAEAAASDETSDASAGGRATEGGARGEDPCSGEADGASWPRRGGGTWGHPGERPGDAAADVCAPHDRTPDLAANVCAANGLTPDAAADVCAAHTLTPDTAADVCAPRTPTPDAAANVCAHHGPAGASPAGGCSPHAAAAGGASVLPELDALLAGLADADAFELDARLRRAVALEQRSEAALAPLLRRAFDARLHRRAGFASFDAFARERLSLSPRKARALLRLERGAAACPPLREAFAAGRLSWVQAQVLLPLLLLPELRLPEVERFRARWVARAERTTVRCLEEEVDAALLLLSTDREAFLAGGGLADRPTCAQPTAGAAGTPAVANPGPASPGVASPAASSSGVANPAGASPAEPTHAVSTDAAPAASLPLPAAIPALFADAPHADATAETERFMFFAPRDVARLFHAVLCSVRRGLERAAGGPVSAGRAAEWMFDHALEAWGANEPRTRREHRVFERDGWRCTVPGCTSYRNLHDHHVRFRSAGGGDDLANRTTLCAFHHLRGVHAGRVRCQGEAPHGLRFELGLRPEQPPLVVYGPGERVASPSADAA